MLETVGKQAVTMVMVFTMINLQCYHRGYGSDHSVLEDSQLTPEQQHPDRETERKTLTSIHPSIA